jgi:hypothetical protein
MSRTAVRRAVIAGAVAAAVLVGVGVWAAVADRSTSSAVPAPAPAAVAPESACGLPGSAEGSTPPATWEDAGGGWTLPVTVSDGPGVRDPHGPWSCYTRTPIGAVLAGYVISMRMGLADDWQAVVRTQTQPGPGQQAALGTPPAPMTDMVQLRGFRVVAFDGARATVGYYLHTSGGEYDCTANLAWVGGDWRLLLQDDGSSLSGCTRGVPETFTPWGPA